MSCRFGIKIMIKGTPGFQKGNQGCRKGLGVNLCLGGTQSRYREAFAF